MNYKMVLNTLGKTMTVCALFLVFPLVVGVYYGENCYLAFLTPILVLAAIGVPLSLIKTEDKSIYAKEGFVIVASCWIILSVAGALPFVVSGVIPRFVDALFETVSGFTTTGASVLDGAGVDDLYANAKGLMCWRMFTHWIGGMGVLVFLLALLPSTSGAMHLYRAESPGPSASKFVSKMRRTAVILYAIYLAMTVLCAVMLSFGGMGVYDSVLNAFSIAGTGGLNLHGAGVAYYNSAYVEIVMSVFMFLFAVNFNFYYLILTGEFVKAFKSEEVRVFFIIVVVSSVAIALNILTACGNFATALRYAFFQVTSISSTTGASSVNFNEWPSLSKAILLVLTIVGACGGSTGGGLKVSRMLVLCKSGYSDVKKMVHPRAVLTVRLEGEAVSEDVQRNVRSFFILWVIIVIACTLILSIDPFSHGDVLTDFTATLACIGNVGPGLNAVGPAECYAGYNALSKTVLSVAMLAGRLEIFPLVIMLSPRTWKKAR